MQLKQGFYTNTPWSYLTSAMSGIFAQFLNDLAALKVGHPLPDMKGQRMTPMGPITITTQPEERHGSLRLRMDHPAVAVDVDYSQQRSEDPVRLLITRPSALGGMLHHHISDYDMLGILAHWMSDYIQSLQMFGVPPAFVAENRPEFRAGPIASTFTVVSPCEPEQTQLLKDEVVAVANKLYNGSDNMGWRDHDLSVSLRFGPGGECCYIHVQKTADPKVFEREWWLEWTGSTWEGSDSSAMLPLRLNQILNRLQAEVLKTINAENPDD